MVILKGRGGRAIQCKGTTVDCGLWTADCGLRTADCGLRTADCGLRIADGVKTRRLDFGSISGLRGNLKRDKRIGSEC